MNPHRRFAWTSCLLHSHKRHNLQSSAAQLRFTQSRVAARIKKELHKMRRHHLRIQSPCFCRSQTPIQCTCMFSTVLNTLQIAIHVINATLLPIPWWGEGGYCGYHPVYKEEMEAQKHSVTCIQFKVKQLSDGAKISTQTVGF